MQPYSYRDDPSMPPFPDDRALVVYDGDCVMCSGWVQFILRRDPGERFRFVGAGSPLGQALYRHYGLDPVDYDSHILIEDGAPLFHSAASLRILQRLGGVWGLVASLRSLPEAWRDLGYRLIARNRYRLFGRRAVCHAPEPGFEHRFLA